MLSYFVSRSNFRITFVLHYFKFHCFGFRNSNTPFYLLNHNIFPPILSRKCFYIFFFYFFWWYLTSVALNNQYVSSPLDVHESFFLSPTASNIRIDTLDSIFFLNKSAIINNLIFKKIDILYIKEIWINDGQFINSLLSSSLPPDYILS